MKANILLNIKNEHEKFTRYLQEKCGFEVVTREFGMKRKLNIFCSRISKRPFKESTF